MRTTYLHCSNCGGIGYETIYVPHESEETGETMNVLHATRVMCQACNGKGYKEYAAFSIEEAKAILEHCGLNTESVD